MTPAKGDRVERRHAKAVTATAGNRRSTSPASGQRDGSARWRTGDAIGGRYLVRRWTRGGVGDIYFCTELRSGQPVALKTLRSELTGTENREGALPARFEAEVRLWISLPPHPHVVTCYYLTAVEGVPLIVMEWVDDPVRTSTSLGHLLRSRGKLEPRRALEVAAGICRGLLHVQEAHPGFVHRDLKSDNVLLAADGTPKVTDFGFAQLAHERWPGSNGRPSHRSNAIVGTPDYMAPEQWERGLVDERADIYGLGCILHRMLTGQHPFAAETRAEWRAAHEQAPVPRAGEEVPPAIAELAVRCLEKQRDARPPSVRALLAEVASVYRLAFDAGLPEARATPPAPVAEAPGRLGNTLYHLGDYAEAVDAYTAAIAGTPELAVLYFGRATALQALGRDAEAVDDYDRALSRDPRLAPASFNRALLYAARGERERAVEEYSRALDAEPELAEVYNNRGLLELEAGRREEALIDFSRALDLGELAARWNRATVLLELGRASESLPDVDALVVPGAPSAVYLLRARARCAAGMVREALDDLDALIDAGAGSAEVHRERARCYALLGQHHDAIGDLTLVIRRDHTDRAAYRQRTRSFAAAGMYQNALADCARIIELEPEDATAYYEMGMLLASRGCFEEAAALLTEATRRGHAEAADAWRRFGGQLEALGLVREARK